MKCPVCENVRMREVEREGVLIDVCPDCKGVWLDRGELDKLMQGEREYREYDDDDRFEGKFDEHKSRPHDSGGYGGYDKHGHKRRKKKSMFDVFGDIFD
ncbi:zf-TFIIB domain-containing protein [Paenibacillus humicola]|uniref:TFIIB-type zinc ribbon-containing protein n=1 Tax=Paenibacillus humicola TaxID=3110540 RepID=UPI00237A6276|nr:zf-TFIIB domain-containing protein [Paenibacillus humicola]